MLYLDDSIFSHSPEHPTKQEDGMRGGKGDEPCHIPYGKGGRLDLDIEEAPSSGEDHYPGWPLEDKEDDE